jgi:hypothetical protein
MADMYLLSHSREFGMATANQSLEHSWGNSILSLNLTTIRNCWCRITSAQKTVCNLGKLTLETFAGILVACLQVCRVNREVSNLTNEWKLVIFTPKNNYINNFRRGLYLEMKAGRSNTD